MASDLDRQIERLSRCEIITENEVKNLCDKAREILLEESNVQEVDAPVTVSITNISKLYKKTDQNSREKQGMRRHTWTIS